jgi:secondary thiamine-phosphate synthase enzyme
MQVLKVRSHQREELVEFTDEVQRKLTESGAKEGVVVLFVQHTTAGLTVNENADPDVPRDMLHALRTLIPQHGMGFRHGEENSDAHIKTSLVGPSVTIPFSDGKLLLGRWQGIFLCESYGSAAVERRVIKYRVAEPGSPNPRPHISAFPQLTAFNEHRHAGRISGWTMRE